MTWQSAGSGGIPGVTSDGKTPGGAVVAGGLTAGDPAAASVPSFVNLNGSVTIQDAPGNVVDGDATLVVLKSNASTHFASQVDDQSTGGAAPFNVSKQGITQFQVDGDGIQVHGKLKTGASAAHALGAYSGNSVPIYDEAGTLLGYMPLYA